MSFSELFEKSNSSLVPEELELKESILNVVINELSYRLYDEDETYESLKAIDIENFNDLKEDMGSGRHFDNYLSNSLNSISNDLSNIFTEFDRYFCSGKAKNADKQNEMEKNCLSLKISILNISNAETCLQLWKMRSKDIEDKEEERIIIEMVGDLNKSIIEYKDEIKELLENGFTVRSESVAKELDQDIKNIMLEINIENSDDWLNTDNPEHGKYWADRMAKNELDTPGGYFDT